MSKADKMMVDLGFSIKPSKAKVGHGIYDAIEYSREDVTISLVPVKRKEYTSGKVDTRTGFAIYTKKRELGWIK